MRRPAADQNINTLNIMLSLTDTRNTLNIMLSLTDTRNTAEITRLTRLINHLQRLADELEWAPMRREE
jgi:hypothetical protein